MWSQFIVPVLIGAAAASSYCNPPHGRIPPGCDGRNEYSSHGQNFYHGHPNRPAIYEADNWSPPPGPVTTLRPGFSHDWDGSDLAHLDPTYDNQLYYSEYRRSDPKLRALFALLDATSYLPSVVLDHSRYIRRLQCTDDGFRLQFSTERALRYAMEQWIGSFIAVTSVLDCDNNPSNPQNAFWRVDSVAFIPADFTARLFAREVSIDEALQDIFVTWGTHNPDDSNPSSGTGVAASSPSASSTTGLEDDDLSAVTPTGSTSVPMSCGAPPSASVLGFPAAACGPDFDETLDAKLGYLDFNDNDFSTSLQQFAGGLDEYLLNEYDSDDVECTNENATERRRRALHRRGWNPWVLIQKGASKIASKVSSAVVGAIDTVKKAAQEATQVATKFINDQIDKFTSGSIDTNVVIDLKPKTLVDSQYWGKAYSIFSAAKTKGAASGTLDVYCVGCNISGNAHIAGQMGFSIATLSLSKGSISLDGSITANLGLGVAAAAAYSYDTTKTIVSTGAPGFSIPNIITVGPVLALDAKVNVDVKANGQLFFGATASVDKYEVRLDIVDSKQSRAVFQPKFKHTFSASGQINAEARFGLPLSVGVGLDIPILKYRRTLSVVNEPFVNGSVTYTTSTSPTAVTCNNGFQYDFALGDDLYVDFFGASRIDLYQAKGLPSANGCWKPLSRRQIDLPSSSDATGLSLDRTAAAPASVAAPLSNAKDVPGDTDGDGILEPDELRDAASKELDKLLAASSHQNENGIYYAHITDVTDTWHLSADDTGVFSLQRVGDKDSGLVFGAYKGVVATDAAERLIYYFPDTMKQFGVSRLRIGAASTLPKTADLVNLASIDYDQKSDTPGLLVAMDTLGDTSYLVACNIDGNTNKIFLVNDADKGPAMLQDKSMQWIVTGGVTTDCKLVSLYFESSKFKPVSWRS